MNTNAGNLCLAQKRKINLSPASSSKAAKVAGTSPAPQWTNDCPQQHKQAEIILNLLKPSQQSFNNLRPETQQYLIQLSEQKLAEKSSPLTPKPPTKQQQSTRKDTVDITTEIGLEYQEKNGNVELKRERKLDNKIQADEDAAAKAAKEDQQAAAEKAKEEQNAAEKAMEIEIIAEENSNTSETSESHFHPSPTPAKDHLLADQPENNNSELQDILSNFKDHSGNECKNAFTDKDTTQLDDIQNKLSELSPDTTLAETHSLDNITTHSGTSSLTPTPT